MNPGMPTEWDTMTFIRLSKIPFQLWQHYLNYLDSTDRTETDFTEILIPLKIIYFKSTFRRNIFIFIYIYFISDSFVWHKIWPTYCYKFIFCTLKFRYAVYHIRKTNIRKCFLGSKINFWADMGMPTKLHAKMNYI